MKQPRRSASCIAFAMISALTTAHARADDCVTTAETVPGLKRPAVTTIVRNKTDDFQVVAGLGPVGRPPDPTYKTLDPGKFIEKTYNLEVDSMDIKVILQNFTGPGGAVGGEIVCLYRITRVKDATGSQYDTSWIKLYDDLCPSQKMESPNFEVSCNKEWDETYRTWKTVIDLKH
jgi:hypothetical protein